MHLDISFFKIISATGLESPETNWVSWIAIIISVATAFLSYFVGKRSGRHTIESAYFEKIFGNALRKELPNAFDSIYIDEKGVVQGSETLFNMLNTMRTNARYFAFSDRGFYCLLIKRLEFLQDYLMNAKNTHYSDETSKLFLYKLDKNIRKLYSAITKRYYGTKLH